MSPTHPAATGAPVAIWFANGRPARLVVGTERMRVVGPAREADINGERYWRLGVRSAAGRGLTVDVKRVDGAWLLVGAVEETAPVAR